MDDLLEQLRDVLDLYAVAPTPGVVRDVVDAARAVLAEHDKSTPASSEPWQDPWTEQRLRDTGRTKKDG